MEPHDELKGLLYSLDGLGEGALLALGVEPTAKEAHALRQARKKAAQLAEFRGRSEDLERLQGEIVTWGTAGGARSGRWVPNLPVAGTPWLADLREGALRAITDAATACLLNGDLDPDTRATLRRRWNSVVQ